MNKKIKEPERKIKELEIGGRRVKEGEEEKAEKQGRSRSEIVQGRGIEERMRRIEKAWERRKREERKINIIIKELQDRRGR